MKVLVTGATGFIGTTLVKRMIADDRLDVRTALRRLPEASTTHVEEVQVGDIHGATNWQAALAGVESVVHLAARVHIMQDSSHDPLEEFRRVNVDGTLNLARQAAASGSVRFVYLSSIKVNGEEGSYVETDPPRPEDAYGTSKYEAEIGLRSIAEQTGMGVVIIRTPIVYGPGVKANFQRLMRSIARGTPLPLGRVDNRRSMAGVDNLADFIVTCLLHPAAANETFFVSDGEDLSTSELVRRLARAMGRRPRLVPVPPPLIMMAATLVGKRAVAHRLLASLQVDTSKARRVLGWTPPISVDEGLRRTVASI
jgi:UDP-glucose 4-epimerase